MDQILTVFPPIFFDTSTTSALLPLLILGFGGTLSLIISASKFKDWSFIVSLLVMVISIASLVPNLYAPPLILSQGILTFDFYGNSISLILQVFTLLALFLFWSQGSKENIPAEVYPLSLFSLAGGMLLVSTQHLVFMFIALEIMSLGVYVMVAIRRASRFGAEAAMKYFILGGLSSAIFLYGSSLLFGVSGSFVLSAFTPLSISSALFFMGSILVLAGLLFKVGAVPFHSWIPDVYQGAPLSVTGHMGTVVKLAAFGLLLRFIPIFLKIPFLLDVLSLVAILTMIIGNFSALVQKDLKRLLAYSSISHTGYLLIGVLAVIQDVNNLNLIIVYLVLYGFSNLGAFATLLELGSDTEKDISLISLEGVGTKRPILAGALALFLLGMAGIPFTSGFIGKYLIFSSGVSSGQVPLVVVAVLTSLISVYYYFKIIIAMFMKEPAKQSPVKVFSLGSIVVTFIGVVVLVSMGLFPQPIMEFFGN